MNDIVVEFKNVTKIYKLFKNDKRRLLGLLFKNVSYKEKRAVNNASFAIKRGEAVALFGKNGAGKSTILKMITGVSFPTTGEIIVKGRVSALLELSSGFDPEFTGRENIYLKGQLLGLKNNSANTWDAILPNGTSKPYPNGTVIKLGRGIKINFGNGNTGEVF